jgi:hypothetical protein
MIWTNLLYGWLVMTNLVTTGQVWYASPSAHGDLRAVDEIEILLGSAERCIATETNATGYQATPLTYVESIRGTNGMITVTNALTWQLAGKTMLTSNDASFKLAIPYYVQTNTVTNYTTNMLMHTFTGMVDSLGIGFSNWPYQVEYTNYEDRYKVLNFMEWTKREAVSTNMDWWYGTAQYETTNTTLNPSTWTEVYNAAAANYSLRTNEVDIMEQDCTKKWWLETKNVGSNVYQTNLLVTTVSNYIAVVTNIYFCTTITEYTNEAYRVTGGDDVYPDVRGDYLPVDDYYYYADVGAYLGGGLLQGPIGAWTNTTTNLVGVYYPADINAAGIVTSTLYYFTNSLDVACGSYTQATDKWYRGDWILWEESSEFWVCSTSLNYTANNFVFYMFGSAPTSSVSPSQWTFLYLDGANYKGRDGEAESYFTYTYSNSVIDPSGTFTPNGDFESKPAWINGAWSVVYSNGWYYITTSTNELSPAWKRETESAGAHSPGLTYSIIVGTNIAGTATAVYRYLYEPVYQTNIIYECSLRKVSADYYAYTGTDVAHAVQGFYVWPSVLTLLGSDSNVFSAHGLAITNDVWNEVYDGVGGFTNATENTQNFGGSLAATPPEEGPNPTESIPSVTSGFILNVAPRFIFDWNFLYGTNRYW